MQIKTKITDTIRRGVLLAKSQGETTQETARKFHISPPTVRKIVAEFGTLEHFDALRGSQASTPKPAPAPPKLPEPISTPARADSQKTSPSGTWRERYLARKVKEGKVKIQLHGELRNLPKVPDEQWLENAKVMCFMDGANKNTIAIVQRTEGMKVLVDFCTIGLSER